MRAAFSGATSPLKQTLISSVSAGLPPEGIGLVDGQWNLHSFGANKTRIEPCPFSIWVLESNQLNFCLLYIFEHLWFASKVIAFSDISMLWYWIVLMIKMHFKMFAAWNVNHLKSENLAYCFSLLFVIWFEIYIKRN